MIYSDTLQYETKGYSDIINITNDVQNSINKSGLKNGIVNIFVIGSTASISTIEYEPALVADMKEQLNNLIPEDLISRHSQTWGDDNGFSHIRATLMGPGTNVPFNSKKLTLGTWQQIILIDHDNRKRSREIHIQILGE